MAAQDQKISPKRRRLFKALSTAPVVMTLQSGSAMATASAINCIDKQQLTPLNTLVKEAEAGPDTGYVYERHSGYEYTSDGTCSTYLDAGWIVDINGDLYEFETRASLNSNAITDPDDCLTHIGPRTDVLLLVVYQPDSSQPGLATTVGEVGIVPIADPNAANNQGLTGSCLVSITGTPLPANRRLSQG
jgi:hypothetical protein